MKGKEKEGKLRSVDLRNRYCPRENISTCYPEVGYFTYYSLDILFSKCNFVKSINIQIKVVEESAILEYYMAVPKPGYIYETDVRSLSDVFNAESRRGVIEKYSSFHSSTNHVRGKILGEY